MNTHLRWREYKAGAKEKKNRNNRKEKKTKGICISLVFTLQDLTQFHTFLGPSLILPLAKLSRNSRHSKSSSF